jgi:transposase
VEPARPGGEFFVSLSNPNHRRYEGLRAYLLEGLPAAEASARVGWSIETLRSAVRDFRAGKTGFFATPRPGPVTAPAKEAARRRIIELRLQGFSAIEISEALEGTDTPLNRTSVAEVLRDEGLPRLSSRPLEARGRGRRAHPPRARRLVFDEFAARSETKVAGLLLAVPELVAEGVAPIRPGRGGSCSTNLRRALRQRWPACSLPSQSSSRSTCQALSSGRATPRRR